eukprot:Skav203865  [mRNA]  locus=scaffold1031:96193:109448:- [translate_table: standard]
MDGVELDSVDSVDLSLRNETQSKEPVRAGAMEMQNCLCAYKITPKAGGGVHVLNTQQVNEHPWPMSARAPLFHAEFEVDAGPQEADVGTEAFSPMESQASGYGWSFRWHCGLCDNSLCSNYPHHPQCNAPYPSSFLSLSKTLRPCCLPSGSFAAFAKVFNAIAAKRREAQWNPRLQKLNITGFSDAGIRGVHEVVPDGSAGQPTCDRPALMTAMGCYDVVDAQGISRETRIGRRVEEELVQRREVSPKFQVLQQFETMVLEYRLYGSKQQNQSDKVPGRSREVCAEMFEEEEQYAVCSRNRRKNSNFYQELPAASKFSQEQGLVV